MNYKETLDRVTVAKLNHLLWRLNIEATQENVKNENLIVEVSKKDCEFGKWFYKEGNDISFLEHYDKIEHLHDKIHELYSLYLDEIKNTKKGSFLNSKSKHKNIKADNILKELFISSEQLVEVLEKLEKLLALLLKSDKIFLENQAKKKKIENNENYIDLDFTPNQIEKIEEKNEVVKVKKIVQDVKEKKVVQKVNKNVKVKTKEKKEIKAKKEEPTILNIQDEINRILGI